MARSWIIDLKGFARKVKDATLPSDFQIKDCGAYRECPNCHYSINNSDVFPEWPGLPAGVKFDPSDIELLEHLAEKCGVGSSKPHMFIDELIVTLEGDKGICYTHPENLPGIKKDGSSAHFFHRTINAYATGQRKRRKIHNQHILSMEHFRWHKTGKTKPVIENGIQKGFKKIMVLYGISKKGSKPDKSNWVMHQYHLGTEEDEKDGEYVVSKVFYQQQKQAEKYEENLVVEDSDIRTSPRTPKTYRPEPPRPAKTLQSDDIVDGIGNTFSSSAQEAEFNQVGGNAPPSEIKNDDNMVYSGWLAGESQAVENYDLDKSLLCKENFESSASSINSGLNHIPLRGYGCSTNEVSVDNNGSSGIHELDKIELDPLPDFKLSNLGFGSQESIFDWLDRF
ncbi:NAC domain-containing protein [Quillaja saponaria]|uniref:NAC domain-containing protein n=1 Tax=Quillaja saponaria TaxID=32244 RepID=A0AAD7M697_QUISA|nr:NAC domain-containing protein [Quillaja saponaria]